MAKTKDRTCRQQFMDAFKILTRSRNNWEVWSDFVHLTACSISNVLDTSHYVEREEQYMRIISRYTVEEANLFPKLYAITIMALEANPEQDFLGQIHQHELELGNVATGSFYTPYNVGQLMSELTWRLDPENQERKICNGKRLLLRCRLSVAGICQHS